jgi:putative sigma-54 modulation protein
MKLTVTGRHLVVSDADRTEIAGKVGHLDRILNDGAVSAACALTRERQDIVCELTVHARGNHMLHGVGRHRRLGVAAAMAVSKVSQQAHKLADRWKTRRKAAASTSASSTARAGRDGRVPESPRPRVIRSRGYAAKPMTVADAALLLTSSDRPVLVFRHAASEAVTVMYRRPDGHFGLIEPDR